MDDNILELLLDEFEKIHTRLDAIDTRLNTIDTQLAEIKETQAEHTVALNELIEWADEAQIVVKVPLGQVKKAQ